jgi:hypothetical protein
MQFIGCSTFYTLATVALPNLQFDVCWNNTTVRGRKISWQRQVIITGNGGKPKLKYLSVIDYFATRIYQMENSVV